MKWIISDTHFGHGKLLGGAMRPFSSITEHDEFLIARWNERVDKQDVVYHLGDVALKPATTLDRVMPRLKGKKKLILGNHDTAAIGLYLKYFTKVYGSYVIGKCVLTHVPIHPDCFKLRFDLNYHGHLHAHVIADPRYLNCSVECTGFCPVRLE